MSSEVRFNPGFYTKFQIDQNGKILNADQIEAIDLPRHTHDLSEIHGDLQAKIIDVLATFFANSDDNAVEFTFDRNTGTVSADVRIDGTTVKKNDYGQLWTEGGGGEGSGETQSCATHTHTVSQIIDFEDAVKALLDQFSSKNITIEQISNLIDNSTIVINDYGQLASVTNVVVNHTHNIQDIVDYEAPIPAALQRMDAMGTEVDYNAGVIDFSSLNIGYSILALSQYLKDVTNRNISILNERLNQLSIDNSANSVLLSVHRTSLKNTLYDKVDHCYREVYCSRNLYLYLDYLPKTTGQVALMLDDAIVSEVSVGELRYLDNFVDRFCLEKVYNNSFGAAKILKIRIEDLCQTERVYNFKLKYTDGESVDFSNTIAIYVTPYTSVRYEISDITNTHEINQVEYYNDVPLYKYAVRMADYSTYRFINDTAGFKNGVLYGFTDKDISLSLPNLFDSTDLVLSFSKIKEKSDSELYHLLTTLRGAVVINDVVTPTVYNTPFEATFTLPSTETCNALKLWNCPSEGCAINKGNRQASDAMEAIWPNISGQISLDESDCKLLWLAGYDDGKRNLNLTLKSKNALNLKNIKYEALTL